MTARLISVALFVLALLSVVEAGVYQLKTGTELKNPSGGMISYTNVSTPYLSDGRGYGAEKLNDSNFVTGQGEITSVWESVPDDALDAPPAWVIARETCNVWVAFDFFLPGDADFWADNDLGFDFDFVVMPVYDAGGGDDSFARGGQTIIGSQWRDTPGNGAASPVWGLQAGRSQVPERTTAI